MCARIDYPLASSSERIGLLKEWVEPDLLVLDDLFLARRISEHAAEVLQAIVHQRYKLRRAIVVTSNRVVQDWGEISGRRHHGHHHPGSAHASLHDAGV